MRLLRRWWSDRSGATAIEYSLIGVIMTLTIIGAFTALEDELIDLFSSLGTRLLATL